MVLPEKYEPVAVIQSGQVAGTVLVEHPTQSIERMKTSSFQMKVAERLGDKAWIEDLLVVSTVSSKRVSIQLLNGSVVVDSAP